MNRISSKMFVPLMQLIFLPRTARADNTIETREKKAASYGEIFDTSSPKTDPIGIPGLWGLTGSFVVNNGCPQSFAALADVQSHPKYSNAVKRVHVLEESDKTLLVDNTEGSYGFESTAKQFWTFENSNSTPTITSKSVGTKAPPSWVRLRWGIVSTRVRGPGKRSSLRI